VSSTGVQWHEFSYDDKVNTAPAATVSGLVWIRERWDDVVTLGYFDGFTFRDWKGSDDISVSHWAPVEYPAAPSEEQV
jgi:hypothetical protein